VTKLFDIENGENVAVNEGDNNSGGAEKVLM